MLKQLRYSVTAAFILSLGIVGTATAQLGFTIDPTQGLPGTTVFGQVDPEDVAAQCITTVEGLQAEFQALLEGPFETGAVGGELWTRFFDGAPDYVFNNCDQAAFSLTGITVFGIALNFGDAAVTALPLTFVMTFADLATQQPIGELGHFDPVTGAGSVVVPNLAPGQYPIVATCAVPTFDLDALEAGIRENGAFLESLGFPTCDINSAEFAQYIEQLLGPGADLFTFLNAYGPTFIENISVPGPLGLQFFTVLAQPASKDECKNGGWQQFNLPPPGLGFNNQGQCIAFFNAGLHAGTTAALVQ